MKFRVKYWRWLQLSVAVALSCILLSVSPRGAQATSKFYLPFPASSKYHVTQTWHGEQSHSDYYNKYAVDFRMSIGEPVVAVSEGKVIRSSKGKTDRKGACDRSYMSKAHYVVIDHGNNISSLYLHLSQVDVSVGDIVTQGQVLGKSGDTGWACGAHLHFTFQQTDTVNRYAGKSIRIGFIETKNDEPLWGMSYTSNNILLAKNDPQDAQAEVLGSSEASVDLQNASLDADGTGQDIKNASLDADGTGQDIKNALLHPKKLPDSSQALGSEVKLQPVQNGLLDPSDFSPPEQVESLEVESKPEDIQNSPLDPRDDRLQGPNKVLEMGETAQDDQNDSGENPQNGQDALLEWLKTSKPKETQVEPLDATAPPGAGPNPQAVDKELQNWLNSSQPQPDP
jgi:hypothetical protein